MDIISSAEFRKTYARLTKPTKVTVNGHMIGTWTPGGMLSYNDLPEVVDKFLRGDSAPAVRYDTRPIRPVPKTRK
jgi:hypothetical protein